VKSAKNKQSGKEVAIKFIEKKIIGQEDMAMLAREIDIMKKVSHDNVLKLVETFETESLIALVMEL
jgi:serine/threonine protein kinase